MQATAEKTIPQTSNSFLEKAQNAAAVIREFVVDGLHNMNQAGEAAAEFFVELMERHEQIQKIQGLSDRDILLLNQCYYTGFEAEFFALGKNNELYADRSPNSVSASDAINAVMTNLNNTRQITNGQIRSIGNLAANTNEQLTDIQKAFVQRTQEMMSAINENKADPIYRQDFNNPNSFYTSKKTQSAVSDVMALAEAGAIEAQSAPEQSAAEFAARLNEQNRDLTAMGNQLDNQND